MCVIAICPPNLRPSLETLTACGETNPHGAGVAWRDGNRVHWKKGFHDWAALKKFIDARKGDIVIHFRWASVGEPMDSLCHPFPIQPLASTALDGAARRVLFHNGTWSGWRNVKDQLAPDLGGDISDTRIAAISVAHRGDRVLRTMGGRWVVMSPKGMDIYGEFQTRKGIRYSNLNWVRNLPEHLRGAPVKAVDEHGAGSACPEPRKAACAILPPPERKGWRETMQRMADQYGRRITDVASGETFHPNKGGRELFDYAKWAREQQRMMED